MSRSRQPPLVTGISPNEGIPWTKVTIRGENLGTGPTDLIGLTICGHNCLLTAEWMSASKIVCRVGQAKNDKGDIIVTTKSGGKGTSTVSFKLLKPEKIGILDQSAVWVDEMNYYDMRTDKNKGIPPLSLRPANPLGIEIEKSKLPQKDLEALFHGMSADFTSENFSAAWYLIENHSTTSFEQLKMAVTNLKRQANKKSEGSLAYVKGGLSTFFEAQDALSAIHQKLEADGTEKVEGSMTQKLENVLNRASNTADTLFQEVLGRKDKADSTRNALNVLQRFKFLFNLPLNIKRNIQKGDYDVVINDYEKAKSLFGKTEVQVFKKYYAEVEAGIEDLRELLLKKLLETPSTLHDQKRYIRYLSDLHASGDPAWQCIGAQHKWTLKLMQDCKEGHMKSLKGNPGPHSPMLDLENDVRPSVLGHLSQTASLKRGSSFQSGRDDTWRYKTPHRVAFVEKLTKLVLSQLPNFWKLWISYVNGSLFSETAEKSGQIERAKNVRQRQSDFKKMIQEVMQSLVKLIRGALLPLSLREGDGRQYGGWEVQAELSGQWLAHVIQTIRMTYESLTALEIPNDMLQIIQDLILDLRIRCIMVTLQHTAEEIKRLAEKEDWIVDNEGLTSLPCQFEQSIVHSLQSLKGVVDCKPGEASVFQQPKTQEEVCQLSISIMQVFIYCLVKLPGAFLLHRGCCSLLFPRPPAHPPASAVLLPPGAPSPLRPRGFKMEHFDASLSTYFRALLGPRDTRVKGWFLLDNYIPTFVCSVIYLLIVWLGPKYMKNKQAFSCRGILVVYNLGLTLLSLYMFYELVTGVWEGKYNFFCQGTRSAGESDMKIIRVLWWYYFSKLIEFMDTFFFILRKNNHQITVLHVYHHASMFNIWWFVMNWVPCGHSYFGATLNSFIHVLMYSYYGLSSVPSMRPYLWWKKYITQGQLVQFVLTIIQTTCGVIWPCTFPLGWLYFQIGYMISLIALFTNFYIQTYNKKGASRRKEHLKGHQNGSMTAINGHTSSFPSLENSVKPRKQRKD